MIAGVNAPALPRVHPRIGDCRIRAGGSHTWRTATPCRLSCGEQLRRHLGRCLVDLPDTVQVEVLLDPHGQDTKTLLGRERRPHHDRELQRVDGYPVGNALSQDWWKLFPCS